MKSYKNILINVCNIYLAYSPIHCLFQWMLVLITVERQTLCTVGCSRWWLCTDHTSEFQVQLLCYKNFRFAVSFLKVISQICGMIPPNITTKLFPDLANISKSCEKHPISQSFSLPCLEKASAYDKMSLSPHIYASSEWLLCTPGFKTDSTLLEKKCSTVLLTSDNVTHIGWHSKIPKHSPTHHCINSIRRGGWLIKLMQMSRITGGYCITALHVVILCESCDLERIFVSQWRTVTRNQWKDRALGFCLSTSAHIISTSTLGG